MSNDPVVAFIEAHRAAAAEAEFAIRYPYAAHFHRMIRKIEAMPRSERSAAGLRGIPPARHGVSG